MLVLILGSVATETSHVDNLFPLCRRAFPGSLRAVHPRHYPVAVRGFRHDPQTAEEFDFPPEKSRRLMINSIVCGALLSRWF
ncbi:MAG: hypothetical protein ACLSHC_11590 [Bilophila wadsworthia]